MHHAEKGAEEAAVATTEVMREEAGEKEEAASVEGERGGRDGGGGDGGGRECGGGAKVEVDLEVEVKCGTVAEKVEKARSRETIHLR